jgi:hypothetical protein
VERELSAARADTVSFESDRFTIGGHLRPGASAGRFSAHHHRVRQDRRRLEHAQAPHRGDCRSRAGPPGCTALELALRQARCRRERRRSPSRDDLQPRRRGREGSGRGRSLALRRSNTDLWRRR